MRTTTSALQYYIAALLVLIPVARSGQPHDEFTFGCLPLTTQLSDPIMFPGKQSDHTHLVAGGTAFQRTMEEDTARNAEGTTCGVEIDRSNYWVPELYHKMRNGSFELVENAGISLYYMNRVCNYTEHATDCDSTKHVPIAPPSGLRMVSGNPFLRTYNATDKEQHAITHMCIKDDGSSAETKHLPREPCSKMRSQVFFPSCWDGKNLDAPDHKSHMAYPAIGQYNKGVCPKSHPVAIISIFVEFVFNTEPFPDYKNLVYAMNDTTGYGLHGDFINGWTDQNALQDALKTCTGEKGLESSQCSITRNQKKALTPVNALLEVEHPDEDVGQNGPVPELPGKKPVTGSYPTGEPGIPREPDFPTGVIPTTEPKPTVPGFPTKPIATNPTESQPTTEPGTTSKPETTMVPKPTTTTKPVTKPEPSAGPEHTRELKPPGEHPHKPGPWWEDFDDGF